MCRNKNEGGRRCAHDLMGRIESLERTADTYAQEADEREFAWAGPKDGDIEAWDELTMDYRREAEFARREANDIRAQYNMSQQGQAELQAVIDDPDASTADRAAATVALAEAQEGLVKRREAVAMRSNRVEGVVAVLEQAGVPTADIEDIRAQMLTHSMLPTKRSFASYKERLNEARDNRKAVQKEHRSKVEEIASSILPAAAQEKALAKEEKRFALADEVAKRRQQTAKFDYDTTQEGLEELTARAKAMVKEDIEDIDFPVKFARLEARIKSVEKYVVTIQSDRKAMAKAKRLVVEAMAKRGKSPDEALKAMTARTTKRVNHLAQGDKIARTKVWLTEKDVDAVNREFRKSPEFKEHGEDGIQTYLAARVLSSPFSRVKHPTLAAANANVQIFDQGKKGRHKTSMDGVRGAAVGFSLTNAQQRRIRIRAKSLHTTMSSYIRAMVVDGVDPFAITNDRSKEHWSKKTAVCEQVLESRKLAA